MSGKCKLNNVMWWAKNGPCSGNKLRASMTIKDVTTPKSLEETAELKKFFSLR